jgi:hypothetical protein
MPAWCSVYVDNVVAQAPEQTNHATLLLEYKTGRTINQPLLRFDQIIYCFELGAFLNY